MSSDSDIRIDDLVFTLTGDERSEAWKTLADKHSEVSRIPLDAVYIDMRFQRPLSAAKKDDIVHGYHPQGVGILCGAYVEGGDPAGSGKPIASVDGQTRLAGLNERNALIAAGELADGYPPIADILLEVFGTLDEPLIAAEAAELFKLRNNQRFVYNRDKDRIGLTAGDPLLTEANRQVTMAGFTMFGADDQPATMDYPDVATRIVRTGRKFGYRDLLAKSLQLLADAYGTDVGAVDRSMLIAVASIVRKNGERLDEERFTDVLRSDTVSTVAAHAKALHEQLEKRLATTTELYLVRKYNELKGVEKLRH